MIGSSSFSRANREDIVMAGAVFLPKGSSKIEMADITEAWILYFGIIFVIILRFHGSKY